LSLRILKPPGGEAIGANGNWSLRRLPWTDRVLEAGNAALPAGPLRVLYMVSAPRDQVELDFEREEELLVRALGKAGRNVVFDSGDLGSFDELRERINDFHPHVVHLTGHGVARADAAYFASEDDRGESDNRSATELGQLFAGSGVQCAFVSACQAGRAPERAALGGLAQGLLAEGVPLVIGWTASILDEVATQVASVFYDTAASGQTTVDRALVTARQAARKAREERGDPSWSLPVLYAGTRQALLFDAKRTEPSARPSLVLRPFAGHGGGLRGALHWPTARAAASVAGAARGRAADGGADRSGRRQEHAGEPSGTQAGSGSSVLSSRCSGHTLTRTRQGRMRLHRP
jgi:CHAT domain